MCVASMVIGDWQHPTWPIQPTGPIFPGPNTIPWPQIEQQPDLAKQMLEILAKLEAIDARLGKLEQCKVTEAAKELLKKELEGIASRLSSTVSGTDK